jgi:hypothetical protein
MKHLKIAICFSGQIRTWRETLDDIKRFYNIGNTTHEIDLFAHAWNYNTWIDLKYETVWNGPKYKDSVDEIVSEQELEDYKNAYNFIKFEVDEAIPQKFSAWESPLYSFMRSIQLKRSYELENNFEYDLVIKTRPDAYWDMQNFEYEQPPILAITAGLNPHKMITEFYGNDLNDVMFWGDSFSMDLLSNVYRNHIENTRDFCKEPAHRINQLARRKLGPGSILHKYATDLGLFVFYKEYPWKIKRRTSI